MKPLPPPPGRCKRETLSHFAEPNLVFALRNSQSSIRFLIPLKHHAKTPRRISFEPLTVPATTLPPPAAKRTASGRRSTRTKSSRPLISPTTPRPVRSRSPASPLVDSSRLRRPPAPPVRSRNPPQAPVAPLPLQLDPSCVRPPQPPPADRRLRRTSTEKLVPGGGAVRPRGTHEPPLLREQFSERGPGFKTPRAIPPGASPEKNP